MSDPVAGTAASSLLIGEHPPAICQPMWHQRSNKIPIRLNEVNSYGVLQIIKTTVKE